MTSLLTDSESVQLRTDILRFYDNMSVNNLLDISVFDTSRFTLPPFLRIDENEHLRFIPTAYNTQHIQLNSNDLAELMGYVSITIRLLQIRHTRII